MLQNLKRSKGLNKKAKILGRGNGSGRGNYSTKGLKGQKARTGHSNHPSFEGGQTPLTLRLPKLKGFKRFFKLKNQTEVVNLSRLQADERVVDADIIDKNKLKELGYTKKDGAVKILGNGDFSKKLEFVGMEAFSDSAKEKIKNAGGKIQ